MSTNSSSATTAVVAPPKNAFPDSPALSRTTQMKVPVHFGDCDPAGIVFFPNFSRWMDAASLHFFMQCGVPPWRELVVINGINGTPLLEIQTRFYRAVTYGTEIEIHTCVTQWNEKTFVQRHRVMQHGQLMCEGFETRVFTMRPDPARHELKSIPIPADIKDKCQRAVA
jgi:4-hydroxybenzoyl-CoA thioesterase